MAVEEEQIESMDDTIAATYKDILAREAESDTPASPLDDGTPAEPLGVPAEETDAAKAQRARDEQGRFAKQEEKTEKPAVETPKADKAPTQAGKASEVKTDSPVTQPAEEVVRADGRPVDLTRAPSSWSAAAKAEWSKIPPAVQAEVHRREVDAFKKFNESAPEAELGRNIRSLGEKYHQVIALDGGGDIGRAVNAFLNTASVLRFGTPQQKRQAIDYLEQNYGVPSKQAQVDAQGQPVQPQQQQDFRDPRVDRLEAAWSAEEQRRRSEIDRTANDATTRFLSSTNDKGEPLYPFVDNVLEDMTGRVAAIRARNPGTSHDEALKQAYDAAVWANPETRKVLQAQEVVRLEAQRREENLRKVDSARQAAATNVPRRGAVPAQAPVGTMDDTILETYREITSR